MPPIRPDQTEQFQQLVGMLPAELAFRVRTLPSEQQATLLNASLRDQLAKFDTAGREIDRILDLRVAIEQNRKDWYSDTAQDAAQPWFEISDAYSNTGHRQGLGLDGRMLHYVEAHGLNQERYLSGSDARRDHRLEQETLRNAKAEGRYADETQLTAAERAQDKARSRVELLVGSHLESLPDPKDRRDQAEQLGQLHELLPVELALRVQALSSKQQAALLTAPVKTQLANALAADGEFGRIYELQGAVESNSRTWYDSSGEHGVPPGYSSGDNYANSGHQQGLRWDGHVVHYLNEVGLAVRGFDPGPDGELDHRLETRILDRARAEGRYADVAQLTVAERAKEKARSRVELLVGSHLNDLSMSPARAAVLSRGGAGATHSATRPGGSAQSGRQAKKAAASRK